MNSLQILASSKLQTAKEKLRALEHHLRIDIIQYLHRHPNSYVKQIYKSLDIEQSVASQHLNILKNVGYVIDHRDGKNVHYSLNYNKIGFVVENIDSFLKRARE